MTSFFHFASWGLQQMWAIHRPQISQINHMDGLVKSHGHCPHCSTPSIVEPLPFLYVVLLSHRITRRRFQLVYYESPGAINTGIFQLVCLQDNPMFVDPKSFAFPLKLSPPFALFFHLQISFCRQRCVGARPIERFRNRPFRASFFCGCLSRS